MSYKNYHTKKIIGLSLFHYKMYRMGNKLYLRKEIFMYKILLYLLKFPYSLTSTILNCYIPFSAKIGEGLVLPHGFFGIFISKETEIGKNALIFHQVTIGSNKHTSNDFGSPKLGDSVFIGAGAKIIGKITIGNNVKIGANAIVIQNIDSDKTVVAPKAIVI